MSFAKPRGSVSASKKKKKEKKSGNMTSYVDNKIEMLKERIRKSRDRTKALLEHTHTAPTDRTKAPLEHTNSAPTPLHTPIKTKEPKTKTTSLTPSLRRRIEIAKNGEAMSALRESSEMVIGGRVDFDVLCHVLKHDIKDLTFSEIARLHELADVNESTNKVNLKAFCDLVFGEIDEEEDRLPPTPKPKSPPKPITKTPPRQKCKKRKQESTKRKKNNKSTTLANSNKSFKQSLRSSKSKRVMHFGSYKRHADVDELRKMVRCVRALHFNDISQKTNTRTPGTFQTASSELRWRIRERSIVAGSFAS